jgi:CheY-like chemotaxis protein
MIHFEARVPFGVAPLFVPNQAALVRPSARPMPGVAPKPFLVSEPPRSTVLVVEDEPLIRILLSDLLEGAGIDVEEAADAEQALKRLKALRADRSWCRVLVTDVNLGQGLDGVALAAKTRKSVPGLQVLYVTATPERVMKGRTTPRPGERVLGKPFHTAELVETVQSLVASSTARG